MFFDRGQGSQPQKRLILGALKWVGPWGKLSTVGLLIAQMSSNFTQGQPKVYSMASEILNKFHQAVLAQLPKMRPIWFWGPFDNAQNGAKRSTFFQQLISQAVGDS